MNIAGGLGAMADTVGALNQSLSQYMSNDLQLKAKGYNAAVANANQPTIPAGKLKAVNPEIGKIVGDVPDDTPIGADTLNLYKNAFPDAAGGGKGNNNVPVDGIGDLLTSSGADPDDSATLIKGLKKHGVTSLPTGVVENIIKNNGGDAKTASAISLLKDDPSFQALPDEEKVTRVRNLRGALNGKGTMDIPDDKVNLVVKNTVSAYNAAKADPKNFPNPDIAVAKTLSKLYKPSAVSKVMIQLHNIKTQSQTAPPPSTASKGMEWIKGVFNQSGS